jgi:hypothetical protein
MSWGGSRRRGRRRHGLQQAVGFVRVEVEVAAEKAAFFSALKRVMSHGKSALFSSIPWSSSERR